MNLVALEIPDDPARLAGWLEQHLIGFNLGDLALELAAFHGEAAEPARSVRDLLGNSLATVLERGLGQIPNDRLRQLLLQPTLLLELQEIVLAEGGDYWDRLGLESRTADGPMERGRQRLQDLLTFEAPASEPGSDRLEGRQTLAWYRRPSFVCLATAASVLVGVFLFQQLSPPAAPGWGWNRPGVLALDVPAQSYLNGLADAASDWFNKRPETPAALAGRLNEFRRGCSNLIFAEHRPLTPQDRQWLVNKCRNWAGKLDKHLGDLEAGQSLFRVRTEADDTVNKLIAALRSRAEELSKRGPAPGASKA
jgi:hypothetical protein